MFQMTGGGLPLDSSRRRRHGPGTLGPRPLMSGRTSVESMHEVLLRGWHHVWDAQVMFLCMEHTRMPERWHKACKQSGPRMSLMSAHSICI